MHSHARLACADDRICPPLGGGDGRTHLRVARGDDRGAIAAFLRRLSPSTVQLRWLGPSMALSGQRVEREVARMLEPADAERIVVLAVQGAEVRGIGELAREQRGRAGLALVVEDRYQRRGIGGLLFRALEALALEHGIATFTGDVAPGNTRVTDLLRAMGRRVHLRLSYGSVQFELELQPQARAAHPRG